MPDARRMAHLRPAPVVAASGDLTPAGRLLLTLGWVAFPVLALWVLPAMASVVLVTGWLLVASRGFHDLRQPARRAPAVMTLRP